MACTHRTVEIFRSGPKSFKRSLDAYLYPDILLYPTSDTYPHRHRFDPIQGLPYTHFKQRARTMGIITDVICCPFKVLGAVVDFVIAIACCPCRTCFGCPPTLSETRAAAAPPPTSIV